MICECVQNLFAQWIFCKYKLKKNRERCTKRLSCLCGLNSYHHRPTQEIKFEPDWSWSYFSFLCHLHCSCPWKPGVKQASSLKMMYVSCKSCVLWYLIEKCILINIQFPETVLIVLKYTSKDGLNSTWKCSLTLLNMICYGYKVGY